MGGAKRSERIPAHLVRRSLGEHVGSNELSRVALTHRRLLLDSLHHERLGVRRLVLLVVTEAPVAHDVDHRVVAELGTIGEGDTDRGERRFGVVGIDVDDR